MGCREMPLFDLNEPPPEEEEVNNSILVQPQKLIPSSNPLASNLFLLEQGCQRILNNHAFTHASSSSGFQPFIRSKDTENLKDSVKEKADASKTNEVSPSIIVKLSEDEEVAELMPLGASNAQTIEREDSEMCDMEGNDDIDRSSNSNKLEGDNAGSTHKQGGSDENEVSNGVSSENKYHDSDPQESFKNEDEGEMMEDATKDVNNNIQLGSGGSRASDCSSKRDVPVDVFEEPSFVLKPKDIKGVEANHALRLANLRGKRPKIDEHKEAMLGKKRARQTVFIPMEDVKQAGPIKTSMTKRQASLSASSINRTVKDIHCASNGPDDLSNQKENSNDDVNPGSEAQSKKMNNKEFPMEDYPLSILRRQGPLKQPVEFRQSKNTQMSLQKLTVVGQNTSDPKLANKKLPPPKKQTSNNAQYQDTSVERLLREVTNEKFWCHPEETELECVPGDFDSVEEYVRVFEPLLFEECRAQLYSTWEELTETVSKDAHMMVRVKAVERRERVMHNGRTKARLNATNHQPSPFRNCAREIVTIEELM